jgi:outer membrane autotransporter protein
MSNSKIDNIALDGFNFNGSPSLIIDADLRNKKTDSFLGSKLAAGSSGNMVIEKVAIWKDPQTLYETIYVPFADDEDLFNSIIISEQAKKTFGPIFLYDVRLSGGNIIFEYAHDYNPSVFIAPVTMLTGGYMGQINSYRQAFETVDDSYEKEGKNGLWVKPYAFSEDIKLNERLDVANEGFGAYFGYNGKMTEIYSYTMNFSVYGAYNTLRQTYTGTEINQGGGMFGVTAVLYADNFFTALTANIGIISEHGQGPSSKDNFMMYTKGAALKGGYNIFFSNDVWQLQPSLSFSITSVDMAPYSNSDDVKVASEKFSPFHIEPGIKLISNAFDSFKLYADAAFIIGLYNTAKFSANDVSLPDFSIDPYLQYSIGGYKNVSDNFSAGGEFFGRSGGRSGFGGQLTLKLKL